MIGRLARTDAHEGPVLADGHLYFTSVPRDGRVDIRRLSLSDGAVFTMRPDANMANGMALDPAGRLLVCEQGGFERPAGITRVEPATGEVTTVVDAWRGLPLNSPNDVVVASDGALWFTDPSYGHVQGFRPPPRLGDRVYRFDGELHAVADGFEKPNGLAFSPDERVLYVGDSEACVVKAFDVAGGRLANERLFAEIADGYPDGLKVDRDGNVYTTAAAGIQVFRPDGSPLREIPLAGAVNFCFGGPGLLVTADDAIWSVTLD